MDEKFEKLKNEMFEKYFEKIPHYVSLVGLHDPYDYMLPKGDTTLLIQNLKLFEEYANRMKETIVYDALNDANKIDRQVLEYVLKLKKLAS